ncbi:hypothetical protein AB0P28_03585 [Pseudarthrobacter sp. NPDC089323]
MVLTGSPVTAAGLAEIKPHNDAAIRKGLYQLRAYLLQSKAARGTGTRPGAPPSTAAKRPAWIAGSEPERASVWLVTYSPWSQKGPPTHVRVFAHELKATELLKKGPLPALDRLLVSRRELPKIELPKVMPFPHPSKHGLFGLAVEPLVRDRFAGAFQRPLAGRQRVRRKGPDVLWRELGDLFHELADETGDGYWRDVADALPGA